MKRFYFLQYSGTVFALEPYSRTLFQIVQEPAQTGAGRQRLARTTLDALGVPPGRRHCRRAEIWQYTPLRLLIEYELNKNRKMREPIEAVYPFTTPLTKPLVAFIAQEDWTPEQQEQWEKQQRAKNTAKKKGQRARVREKKNKKYKEPIVQFEENHSLEEELE